MNSIPIVMTGLVLVESAALAPAKSVDAAPASRVSVGGEYANDTGQKN